MSNKNGSVLSVVVTIFIMLIVLCGLLFFLIKTAMITINVDVINDYFGFNLKPIDTPVVLNELQEYEKVHDGMDLKHFISVIGTNEYKKIVVYISDIQHNLPNATADKAKILFMTQGKIANSEEYIKISNDMNYNVVMERNEDKKVESIYIIKLMDDIVDENVNTNIENIENIESSTM